MREFSSGRFAGAAIGVILGVATLAGASTLAQFAFGSEQTFLPVGQSATTPAGGPYDHITFSFFSPSNTPQAAGTLFLLVGFIYERRHTREIAQLRGLQKVAPIMAAVFMLVMLSSIGLPGLNGFVQLQMVLTDDTFLEVRVFDVQPNERAARFHIELPFPTVGTEHVE